MFIGDPSYFPSEKVRATGKVVRSICILDHLPPGLGQAMSAQIIIPGVQVGKASKVVSHSLELGPLVVALTCLVFWSHSRSSCCWMDSCPAGVHPQGYSRRKLRSATVMMPLWGMTVVGGWDTYNHCSENIEVEYVSTML